MLYVQAGHETTGTAVLQAFCPVPLSNIRVSGSGSPRLAKFRAHYADYDGVGSAPGFVSLSKRIFQVPAYQAMVWDATWIQIERPEKYSDYLY